ncbi:MAG: tetratricopeptide repeat protein [Deltaproteobacteria bacterium]|nr:tetratricopeptide repeat protein [Deltaproteobacteria bacterium]
MKKIGIGLLVILFITGCAATFKEKRGVSVPLIQLAINKIQANDLQGSLVELTKALQANPKDPEVHYYLATVYFQMDKPGRALEHAEKAIIYGDNLGLEHPGMKSEAYNLKGSILATQGDYEQALVAFGKTLEDELYTTPELALDNIAKVYIVQKKYDQALTELKKSLEQNSHYAPAWKGLARVYIQQGQYDNALNALKHALLEFPAYTEAHWEIAQLYIKIGNIDEAIYHLNEVVRLDEEGVFGALAEQKLQNLGVNAE